MSVNFQFYSILNKSLEKVKLDRIADSSQATILEYLSCGFGANN